MAVLGAPSEREVGGREELLGGLREALAALPSTTSSFTTWPEALLHARACTDAVDDPLRSRLGVRLLVDDQDLCTGIESLCSQIDERVASLESRLDGDSFVFQAAALEEINGELNQLKDAVWKVARDRVGAAHRIRSLAGECPTATEVDGLAAIETVLSALDRLEVRGRDSSGIHLFVDGAGLTEAGREISELVAQRASDPVFSSGALRSLGDGTLSMVYKAAAEIGELGDNGKKIRWALRQDPVLRCALAASDGRLSVLGHTRWASVGMISEANAHPLNHEEVDGDSPPQGGDSAPNVVAAVNGDIDNYLELQKAEHLRFPDEITTDAKVVPVLLSRRLAEGVPLVEAFRRTVSSFTGSVAIAVQSASDPDLLLLALHGSGQALYVGLLDGSYVVASEPYGVVEQADEYFRMDGESAGNAENPIASRGQIVVLDRRRAGSLEGIHRIAYDGTALPLCEADVETAEITTRDIDRGDYPHYLLKEISQASDSFRKTLRGKVREDKSGYLRVHLGATALPSRLEELLAAGVVRRICVIGQGTAAVAGQAVAEAIGDVLSKQRIRVEAMPATELSGFRLRQDMADTLVVAISQSGTTTDTNRTVDLVRARGAFVVSVVNRRGSDLVNRSDGVLYTSDGRDVEMSVASTKAFYAQVAAGFLLALGLKQIIDVESSRLDDEDLRLLEGLRQVPELLEKVLDTRSVVRRVASRHASRRRHWAVVGSGWSRVAAEEIRIKLSELCYKSIACDITEDKKHIDLSSEPLILVCSAGLPSSTLADVVKEVAIYRAHKAAPVVIATAGDGAFQDSEDTIEIPACHPRLAFVLTTMVGHLFGYEAALAIDREALPLREMRKEIEELVLAAHPGEHLLETLAPRIEAHSEHFLSRLSSGFCDGPLEASTAVRLASLLRYVAGLTPLESYGAEHGKTGAPSVVIEDLMSALTRGVEELTRPVDAIKHQAKTVTVGISRADEALLTVPLVSSALDSGLPRERITYRDLRALAGLDPAVAEVEGYTRYRIIPNKGATDAIEVIATAGVAAGIPSRTVVTPELRGTKHMVASERQLFVARGRSDGRTVILVPEIERAQVSGLLLLHVRFEEKISPAAMRAVLSSYRSRLTALRDAVMETEPDFREELLGELPVADLLTLPILDLVGHWQTETKIHTDEVMK